MPVAPALNVRWTPGNNIRFITTRNAIQWSACVYISRNFPALSLAFCHPAPMQTSPMIGARSSQ